MGCCTSNRNTPGESGNIVRHKSNEGNDVTLKKANNTLNSADNKSTEGNLPSPQVSLEIFETPPHRGKNAAKRKNSVKKELKQVEAWGKKSTIVEADFLQDWRTQRRQSDVNYEEEYERNEVDETAKFEGEINSGMAMDNEGSLSDVLNNDSSHEIIHKVHNEPGNHEESFDVSKIIDVQKFRAANVQTETKCDVSQTRDSTVEGPTLTRSQTDKSQSAGEDFYNEDDIDLIESIEKEYLVNQDNFLPGQIVN